MSANRSKGHLEVVHGSMFGGKTEHLIACLRQAESGGQRVKAFKHYIDDRYDPTHLVTHAQDRFDAIRLKNAEAILDQCDGCDWVGVDEGHFFKTALIAVVQELLDRGISVVVTGISFDAWGRPFDPMPQLVEMADRVVVKQTPCRVCGKPSPFTQRMTEMDALHMAGGIGDYEPRCADHFTPLSCPPETR